MKHKLELLILLIGLSFIECKTNFHTKPIDYYCENYNLSENDFYKTGDCKYVLNLINTIPKEELVKSTIFAYAEYPNGGKAKYNIGYVVLVSNNTGKVYSFVGDEIDSPSERSIQNIDQLISNLNQVNEGYARKDCECDGAIDGVFGYFNADLKPKFGVIFNCYNPTLWNIQESNNLRYHQILEIIGYESKI